MSYKLELVPARLTLARRALGLNKLQASQKLRVSQSVYVRYESGERQPGYHVLAALAEGLETSVAYLTGATDDPSCDMISVSVAEPARFEIVRKTAGLSDAQLRRVINYIDKMYERKNSKE